MRVSKCFWRLNVVTITSFSLSYSHLSVCPTVIFLSILQSSFCLSNCHLSLYPTVIFLSVLQLSFLSVRPTVLFLSVLLISSTGCPPAVIRGMLTSERHVTEWRPPRADCASAGRPSPASASLLHCLLHCILISQLLPFCHSLNFRYRRRCYK